jgi:hypothetical protein
MFFNKWIIHIGLLRISIEYVETDTIDLESKFEKI